MTVSELKEYLSQFPDDAMVRVDVEITTGGYTYTVPGPINANECWLNDESNILYLVGSYSDA